jgi:hypothetical protein
MLQAKASEPAFHNDPIMPDSGALLAPNEPRAPIAILSPAKRNALITCLNGGGTLHKRYGVWSSKATGSCDKLVSGMTVADLSRDGMLTLTVLGKSASAQLTTRGSWFARTAATDIAPRPPRQPNE